MLQGALKSKTVWAGVAVAALSALPSGLNGAGLSAGELGVVGPLLGLLMVWLRSVTTKPLDQK